MADRSWFGRVIKRAAPIMKGARLMASRGNAVDPSRTTNSRMPAIRDTIGAATTAIVVKARGSGMVAPRPMRIATHDSEIPVEDQPLAPKKGAANKKQPAA